MRSNLFSALAAVHPERALVVRGRAIRTFGGLAIVLALGLLCLGVYLIEDEFSNPLASQSIGLFTAAFVLATAMTLLYELLQLSRSTWGNPARCRTPLVLLRANRVARVAARAARLGYELRTDLPYQRCYVDRVRVRA
jgi:hypothetical protein